MPIQRSHHAQQIHGGSGARAAGIPGALPVGNEETGRVPWVPGWVSGQGVQYIQILDVEEVCVSFFVTGCC